VPKGNPEVIALLNDVLAAELTAINQYFLHAEMCNNWGYARLYQAIRKEAIDEMRHAEDLIERILYLEGIPNVQKLNKVSIGETVDEMLKLDLSTEIEAMERLNRGVAAAREAADNGSRELMERILVDEERHTDWLEAQLDQIQQVGLPFYLSQQINA
jgi:bacterioferritin